MGRDTMLSIIDCFGSLLCMCNTSRYTCIEVLGEI